MNAHHYCSKTRQISSWCWFEQNKITCFNILVDFQYSFVNVDKIENFLLSMCFHQIIVILETRYSISIFEFYFWYMFPTMKNIPIFPCKCKQSIHLYILNWHSSTLKIILHSFWQVYVHWLYRMLNLWFWN